MAFNVQSSTLKNIIDAINSATVSIINKAKADGTLTCVSGNHVNQNFGVNCPPPGFQVIGNFDQNIMLNASTDCTLSADAISKVQDNVKTYLQQAFQQVAQNETKSIQEFLAASASFQLANINNISDLENYVNTKLGDITEVDCTNISQSGNTVNISYCGTYGSWSQDLQENATTLAAAGCLTNAAYSALLSDSAFQHAVQDADNKLYSDQKGIASLLSFWVWIIVGIIAVLVLGAVLIFIVFFAFRGKGKSAAPATPAASTKGLKSSLVQQLLQHPELLS